MVGRPHSSDRMMMSAIATFCFSLSAFLSREKKKEARSQPRELYVEAECRKTKVTQIGPNLAEVQTDSANSDEKRLDCKAHSSERVRQEPQAKIVVDPQLKTHRVGGLQPGGGNLRGHEQPAVH